MSPSNSTESRRPGAYAVQTEPQGQPEMFQLKIPANTQPGTTFTFSVGNRRGLTARCPPSCQAGDTVRIAVQPQGTTQYTPLKIANLTTSDPSNNNNNSSKNCGGGAQKMTPQVLRANHELLAVDSKSFVVTVPPTVSPGMQFVAKTPNGQQFLVTCPKNAGPNQQIRMMIPTPPDTNDSAASSIGSSSRQQQQEFAPSSTSTNSSSSSQTKVFEVIAPEGAQPNQVLPVLVCGKRIPITLPSTVVPGQKLKLKVPVQDVLGSIELSYEDKSSAGWYRTIRMSDLKFQWVRVDDDNDNNNNSTSSSSEDKNNNNNTNNDNDNISIAAMIRKKTAFVRKIIHLQGNDTRMPTGHIDLVPAEQAVVESELSHDNRTLVSYASVAHIQGRPLEEKSVWFQNICADLTTPWESGRIKLIVRRRHLLGDSIHAVMSLSRADMRKRWRIEFVGEPAVDSGGVTREWFQLVTEQIFNPDLGLWLSSVNNQICMLINPASDISCPDDHLIYFRFLGRVMGRALFDRQLVQGHMVRHLYKHLLGWPITFEDLQSQDEEFYQSLKELTTMDDVSVLCLDFTITEETLGVKKNVELLPGGSKIEVTNSNLPQYLKAILRYRMLDRTKLQTAELLLGFFDVVPEPALTVFDPNELELILCGLPTLDMDDWESNSIYSGLYEDEKGDNQVVKWFWEVVRDEFDQEMKARLLQFVTGTSGVPARGFSVLQGNDGNIKKFAVHGVDRKSYVYPRSHTCFNRIDLPKYDTKEELHERLKAAITLSATGFDIE